MTSFEQGDTLLPGIIRSLDAAVLAGFVFGGKVALVITLATEPPCPCCSLLLG